ncbi:MAG: ATP-binding cassette domain-containing protein [Oscillospiraceae bacterium]
MIHTVTIERLSKKIRGTVVLQDVGMRLESGKVYGLVGDNGSGKTMLMRIHMWIDPSRLRGNPI